MFRYAGRHRDVPAIPVRSADPWSSPSSSRSSGPRRVVRVVGGAAALSLLGAGAVSATSLTRVGPQEPAGTTAAMTAMTSMTSLTAMTLPVASPEAAMQAVAHQGDLADLTDQRVDAGRASHLLASGTVDAARLAERQAAEKAAAA
jgi:hypothetical protein